MVLMIPSFRQLSAGLLGQHVCRVSVGPVLVGHGDDDYLELCIERRDTSVGGRFLINDFGGAHICLRGSVDTERSTTVINTLSFIYNLLLSAKSHASHNDGRYRPMSPRRDRSL